MRKTVNFAELLKPHSKALAFGLAAVIGEGVANLLEPWPLKVVLDNVLRSRPLPAWLERFIVNSIGIDKMAVLKFAVLAVLAIAVLGAICSYAEKSITTSVS